MCVEHESPTELDPLAKNQTCIVLFITFFKDGSLIMRF
jgi:hypothetical protein